MEQSNSLLLNECALQKCKDSEKPIFLYEWLRYLDRILLVTQKADLKSVQKQLVEQLLARILAQTGPLSRVLLARCIAKVYSVGETYSLFETINFCNDTLKGRDDSLSHLPVKLAALACLGSMYESLGRLVGRSYEETFHHLSKWIRNAESQGRVEIMVVLSKMISGLGSAASSVFKELYKILKAHMTDRVMSVRVATINCLATLVPEYPFLYTNELESISTMCFKALECSNYEVRLAVAHLFAVLFTTAQGLQKASHSVLSAKPQSSSGSVNKNCSVEELFNILSLGFLRGGIGGFLKSGSNLVSGGQKEIRVGVTLAYIEFIRRLGPAWLERNMNLVLKHLIELVVKFGSLSYTNNLSQSAEVIFMRRCIGFILRSTVGTMLSEQVQIAVCKQIGVLLAECINSFDYNVEPGSEVVGPEAYASAQASTVILLEISCFVRQIGTAVTPLFVEASGIMEPIFACLLHPVLTARIAAAWCLRCATISVPSQLTPLIDRCISRYNTGHIFKNEVMSVILEHMKACSDAISGYSLALSALLTGSSECKLGIPHGKSRQVFSLAEDMIRTATQSNRLAQVKVQAGWMLVSAVLRLGRISAENCLQRLILLWKTTFPRSLKEAEGEKTRGDAFTWSCTLEARAGALASMAVFAENCASVLSDEIIDRMVFGLECSLLMLSNVGVLVRAYGNKLKPLIALTRIRLYGVLNVLPPSCYERLFSSLLRELVAEMTLADNLQSTWATSLLPSLCVGVEDSLLGAWLIDTDQAVLEYEVLLNFVSKVVQLHIMQNCQPNEYPAIENDYFSLLQKMPERFNQWPEPHSVFVAVIDEAIVTYGRLYVLVPSKHKMQMTEHFAECIKNTKNSARQLAIQKNVFACLLVSLKTVGEQKVYKLEGDALRKVHVNLIASAIAHPNPLLRCAAAESLGRLAQAAGDAQFVAAMAQFAFDKLQSYPDALNRTGYALSLGSLHRYVGSLGSGQHLDVSVKILLALAEDNRSSIVQAWSTLALSLIADTAGGMFRGYVDLSLSLSLKLLLVTPSANVEVIQCVGKLVSALITTVGPELQFIGPVESTRNSFLIASAMMLDNSDPVVEAEAIFSLQQLHLFAPRYVHLDRLVTHLCRLLSSPHLILRKASVCCLRQLVQKEAKEVREHAQTLVPQGIMNSLSKNFANPVLPEFGLEGALLAMLDVETDLVLRQHIKETLISLVQAMCGDLLSYWLSLCKDILASSAGTDRSTIQIDEKPGDFNAEEEEDKGVDDDVTLQSMSLSERDEKPKLLPRWPTRVFVSEIVQKLMTVCNNERAHLDLSLAKELQISSGGRADYLVLHLSDLVRMSFMGATSENTTLRLAGLSCLQDVINRFSTVPEPEFPGHVILEQFQAQVGAALRPAFVAETPSDVTAAACEVCSTWIGSGVARDLNDLRRVHQLLVSSLTKLTQGSINTQLYSESAATLEKLAILKAWAEVYIVAVEQESKRIKTDESHSEKGDGDNSVTPESLLSLVTPELCSLVEYWLAALRDSALLSLPSEFAHQLPVKGGAFYVPESIDSCKEYYRTSWPPILLATVTWLNQTSFEIPCEFKAFNNAGKFSKESHFYIMLGICIEALCSYRSYTEGDQTVQLCLRSLKGLMGCGWARLQFMKNVSIAIELLNVLYRLILTRDNLFTQRLCGEVVIAVLDAADYSISQLANRDVQNANVSSQQDGYVGGEGDLSGLKPQGSLAFAVLEVSLCILVRQMPQLNSMLMNKKFVSSLHYRKYSRLPTESNELIKLGINALIRVPSLCTTEGKLVVLPAVLYLVIGVLRESSTIDQEQLVPDTPPGHVSLAAASAIQALRTLTADIPPIGNCREKWLELMRSALRSLLNLSDDNKKVDTCVMMLAVTVFISSGPSQIVLSNSDIFHATVKLLRNCLNSTVDKVVLKCLQSLSSLFTRAEISVQFIKELASDVLNKLRPFLDLDAKQCNYSKLNEEDFMLIQEIIRCFEVIFTNPHLKKEIEIVNMLVQILCCFLCEDPQANFRQLSPTSRKLHDYSLQRLNSIGATYPEYFKKILFVFPALKTRVESAVKHQASRQTNATATQGTSKLKQPSKRNASMPSQPAIKLKMDFSAFETS
uniref:HEAT repeat-containing protein 5B n=1 Tax=Syphacia muris TaxID=451379 RepID=A0A158R4G2_9BILA